MQWYNEQDGKHDNGENDDKDDNEYKENHDKDDNNENDDQKQNDDNDNSENDEHKHTDGQDDNNEYNEMIWQHYIMQNCYYLKRVVGDSSETFW